MNATNLATARFTNLLIARKLRQLARGFRALRADYASVFKVHAFALAGLDPQHAQVGEWSGTSNCNVLGQIADDLVRLLDHDEDPDHCKSGLCLERRFSALDDNAWQKLDIDVRKEVARLARSSTRQSRTSGAKHPEDADVLGTQQRSRLRRLAILRLLPVASNSVIVAALDGFGQGGPSDSVVSKDLTAMRAAGAIHATKLERTKKGDAIVKRNPAT